MSRGVVKYYIELKGFGYILDDSTKDEIFVYYDKLIDEIKKGDRVSYNVRNTRKGLEAFNVRLIIKKT